MCVLLEGRAEVMNEARLFFGLIAVNYMSEVWGHLQVSTTQRFRRIYRIQNTAVPDELGERERETTNSQTLQSSEFVCPTFSTRLV